MIDILDMEHELILPHMEACFAFIRTHESSQKDLNGVLVHCAYGQSRSATICIAYLMQAFKWTLIKAYQTVQRARPCISVNKGFLAQLALFQRMEFDTGIRGNSAAHAEVVENWSGKIRLRDSSIVSYYGHSC